MDAVALITNFPTGYVDTNWTIRFIPEDDEYYVRWSNCIMDRGHREASAYYKNNKFNYIRKL